MAEWTDSSWMMRSTSLRFRWPEPSFSSRRSNSANSFSTARWSFFSNAMASIWTLLYRGTVSIPRPTRSAARLLKDRRLHIRSEHRLQPVDDLAHRGAGLDQFDG